MCIFSVCLSVRLTTLVASFEIAVVEASETTLSEFTRSVLVLRLSWKRIGRGVKELNIFKSCTLSLVVINKE